jgi:hypothetical protein
MTLLADRELQVLFERVQKLLPFESTDLRQANVRSTPLDLDELIDHPNDYLAGMAEAALEGKASFWSDAQLILERWKSGPSAFDPILDNEGFVAVLAALVELPAGLRPVCHAVLQEDLGVIRVMVKHRVSLNHLDCADGVSGGLSPLHVASGAGSIEIVRVLTEAGASLELRSTRGMLAEDLAKAQGHTETASYLRGLMMERRKRGARG